MVAAGRARASIAPPGDPDQFANRWCRRRRRLLHPLAAANSTRPTSTSPITMGYAADDRSAGGGTRFIDRFVHDAAAAGVRQAVILASGLDARATADLAVGHDGIRDRPAASDRIQGDDAGRTRRRADGRLAGGAHRPARRLARGTCAGGLRCEAAHRVDRRGATGVLLRRPRIACWTTSPRSAPRQPTGRGDLPDSESSLQIMHAALRSGTSTPGLPHR